MSTPKRRHARPRGAAALRWALALALGASAGACKRDLRDANEQALLWPEGAPGARGNLEHDRPRLYYFLPPREKANGTAVIVASGGSYGHHGGIPVEGIGTAKWLAEQGITAILLRYRVHGPRRYGGMDFLADGKRAVRTVRSRADELGIDPERIGIMGFSAGGHLASHVSIRCAHDEGQPDAVDPVERESCRIGFAVMIYPVITLSEPYAHARSRRNMLGGTLPVTEELRRQLSTETQVTEDTAPGFLVHSTLDRKVPYQNSVMYHEALKAHGVPTELMVVTDGGHGVGLARDPERMPQMSQWPTRALAWMRGLGMLPPASERP